jgi:flagellar export protein FliJ
VKRFAFRLEPVLRLRSGELEQGRRALAKAESALAQARALADASACSARDAADDARAELSLGRPAGWMRSLFAGAERRYALASDAQRGVAREEAVVQQARAGVLESWRNARNLEWLKDRLRERERDFVARLEERELDDRTRRAPAPENS